MVPLILPKVEGPLNVFSLPSFNIDEAAKMQKYFFPLRKQPKDTY